MNDSGNLPPQSIDLEQAILGAVMLEKGAFAIVADSLTAESFYKDQHKEIYQSCINLFSKGEPIDMLTVTNDLRSRNKLESCGGIYYITELTRGVSSSANIETHAKVIYEMAVKRKLIGLSYTIIKDGYEQTTDALKLADTALKLVYEAVGNIGTNMQDLKSILVGVHKELVLDNVYDKLSGIPSHLIKLNEFTGGWQYPDLIIIAARPGMGKTAFMLNALLQCAQNGFACAIFSLEMSKQQLIKRLISKISDINIQYIMRNNLGDSEKKQVDSVINQLGELPIHIDDTAGLSIIQFRSMARRLVQNHNVKLIAVDYLQLMSGENSSNNKSGNREQEISAITRALKGTCKELKIPIIALSQLSRSVETRGGDKRPLLSDLRESGSIEQDSDLVLFLYRPEYYGIENDEEGNSTDGLCEVILAKHRNGDVGTIKSKFIGKNQTFTDYETQNASSTNWQHIESNINRYEADTPF